MYWKRALVSLLRTNRKVAVFLVLALPLLIASVPIPVVSAKNLKFMEIINIPPDPALDPSDYVGIRPQARDPDWGGPLTGDINAVAYFWETDKNYNTGSGGKVEHFFEDFLIIFNDGGWVVGGNSGIFLMTNKPNLWKYSAQGRVTATSSDRQNFLGSKFYEGGYVTFPAPDHIVGVARGYLGS
jgi:hypothetical protein